MPWVANCRGSHTWTVLYPRKHLHIAFHLVLWESSGGHTRRNLLPSNPTTMEHHNFLLAVYAACSLSLGRPYRLVLMCGAPVTGLFRARKPADSQPGDRAFWKDPNRTPSRSKAGKRGKPAGRRAPAASGLFLLSHTMVSCAGLLEQLREPRYLTGFEGATGPAYK